MVDVAVDIVVPTVEMVCFSHVLEVKRRFWNRYVTRTPNMSGFCCRKHGIDLQVSNNVGAVVEIDTLVETAVDWANW